MRLYILMTFVLISNNCFAGGSHAEVELLQFSAHDNRYILVVRPRVDEIDPYMKGCEIFTVAGSFKPKNFFERLGEYGRLPNEEAHLEALQFLKTKPTKFNLGWIGTGFKRLNPDEACVVESRALELYENKDNSKTVLSNYNGT